MRRGIDEDIFRLAGARGEELLARVHAQQAALPRPVGGDHIDATVLSALRVTERLTAREVAERLHLAIESAGRSLARLELAGLVEGDDAKPRSYRATLLDFDLPPGWKVTRPQGKSWSTQITTTNFYPDGERVVLFGVGARLHDGENAAIRMLDAGAMLQQLAEARGVRVEGQELFVEPATFESARLLGQASTDVVAAWLSTAPSS